MDAEELAAGIVSLAAWAQEHTPVREPVLRGCVRDHLGVDPAGLEVVTEELSHYDHVNFQVALDALAEETGERPELLGLALDHGFRVSLSELAKSGGLGMSDEPGPAEFVQVDVGDRVISCCAGVCCSSATRAGRSSSCSRRTSTESLGSSSRRWLLSG